MSVQNQTLTLLIVTSETSEAERLIGTLREDGLAATSVTIPQADRLQDVITQRSCDMILCCGYDRDVDLDHVFAAYRKLDADVPFIVIGEADRHAGDLIKARRGGARDLIGRNDNEHLKLAVSREFTDLLKRREARALNERLRLCEQRDRELIDVTSAGVAFVQDGLHIDANQAYLDLFGYADLDELQATPFLDLFMPEQQKQIRDLLRGGDASSLGEPLELTVACRRADVSQFKARLLAAPSEVDHEPCLRLILNAIDAPAGTANTGATQPAATSETGLASLLTEIDAHIDSERIVERPFAIFYLRVKSSARLLRDLGLIHGLEKLKEFAEILTSSVAGRGFLARVNDDGFGLIVDGLSEFEAKAFAERLIATARLTGQAAARDGEEPDCEIGYYLVRDRAAAAEDILDAAYRLCIGHDFAAQGQTSGQSPSSLAAGAHQEGEEGEADIVRKIEYALQNDQFKLVYQPIISLMGDNQENYSALVRLFDEHETLYEAKDFIDPAIRAGLIEQIDKWAIRAAIQVIGEQRRAGHNISLFVNLSEDTFRNPNIILWICDCLREFDVRGNWLTFQFQEELVVGNLASIGKLVETLKKIKCRVAVNRFGSIERPELLLQGLKLDYVLLQSSFAQELADDPAKQQQLIALATLAREFNVKSIVTGVEDARALTVLWTAGVDYVQGNFLQRPSPTLEVQT
ncbi:EAL domain-containing protein [Thiocystis violascens]|uniref:EAL domain-containing protein n=1 Tax=Thiocystis violascens (strain ATCC 17096 / DSM 198 / 6111) TaxID=765911 RepID=I3Y5M2_THIV6|nr:EAL domain-containing protein [Thiocystis violascens]AFL72290.1 EAL domain-containing protein [Thiocystis violascens DSM 198]